MRGEREREEMDSLSEREKDGEGGDFVPERCCCRRRGVRWMFSKKLLRFFTQPNLKVPPKSSVTSLPVGNWTHGSCSKLSPFTSA